MAAPFLGERREDEPQTTDLPTLGVPTSYFSVSHIPSTEQRDTETQVTPKEGKPRFPPTPPLQTAGWKNFEGRSVWLDTSRAPSTACQGRQCPRMGKDKEKQGSRLLPGEKITGGRAANCEMKPGEDHRRGRCSAWGRVGGGGLGSRPGGRPGGAAGLGGRGTRQEENRAKMSGEKDLQDENEAEGCVYNTTLKQQRLGRGQGGRKA